MGKSIKFEDDKGYIFPYPYLPVGSIYSSTKNINPSVYFDGTWILVQSFHGGELIATGNAYNNSSNTSEMTAGSRLSFSDTKIPSKTYTINSLVDDILKFDSGTFHIYTQNIVGVVKAYVHFSLHNGTSTNGNIWWEQNENDLPAGTIISNGGQMSPPIVAESYGGASNMYIYKTSGNVNFYVNPCGIIYNTTLTPACYGVKCSLLVEVYAKNETSYVYKRIA